MDIEKLKDLHHFIQSHRKVKKVQTKPVKGLDESNKLEAKFKKENQLRSGFEAILKETFAGLLDISEDFYSSPHDDSSKRFMNDIQKIKPQQSNILAIKVEGLPENENDFWSIFFRDENDDFLQKVEAIGEEFATSEKELEEKDKNFTIAIPN